MNRQRPPVTIILKSCLTGKAVWIYQGPTREAGRIALWRASKKEEELVAGWPECVRRRAESVARFRAALMEHLDPAALTDAQKAAVRRLKSIEEKRVECYTDFYEHVMELLRRRMEDAEIRRQMRERERLERERELEGKST